MNILFQTPQYFPDHCSGGEAMVHDYAKAMQSREHSVIVAATKCTEDIWEGIRIVQTGILYDKEIYSLYCWADVIVSHLGAIGFSFNLCRRFKKPLAVIEHNSNPNHIIKKPIVKGVYPGLIYNSEWMVDGLPSKPKHWAVCRPICDLSNFSTPEAPDYCTLINHNINKGGEVLAMIASALPDIPFMAVKGYMDQVPQPDNVKIVPNTPYIEDVFNSTRVIIMPSKYESYGRVAVEAMACCIPVIATPTPGLKEALGDAGWFIDRDDIKTWIDTVRSLMLGEKGYGYYKMLARKRGEVLREQCANDIDTFEDFLQKRIFELKS